jgi:hypothetical protein
MHDPRFPLRVTFQNLSICHVALETYKMVDKQHPETIAALTESFAKAREQLVRHPGPALCLLCYPETTLLVSAVEFLIEQDTKTPAVAILRDPDRREARMMVAALGDYNATRARLWEERRSRWKNAKQRLPTQAEIEERTYKAKRDEIFREVVGRPDRVDIWGNVVEDESVDHKAQRKAGQVENFKRAYGGEGHHDLRKHAKSTNFHCHPLQSSRVKLNDPDTVEQVKKLNEKLNEMMEQVAGEGYWRHKSR